MDYLKNVGLVILIILLSSPACAKSSTSDEGTSVLPTSPPAATQGAAPSPTPITSNSTPAATQTGTFTASPPPETPFECVPEGQKEIGVVTHVVDGDTIDAIINGEERRIRYIGMDTPERDDSLGPKATAFNAALVEDKIITLYKDVSETDRYGRLLRYVFVDDRFVNFSLVKNGYAQAATYPPDVACAPLFRDTQRKARDQNRGLWQSAPSVTDTPPAASSYPDAKIEILVVDKRDEYVEIRNNEDWAIDLNGWVLLSERGNQDCPLGGTLQPGGVLRIWARVADEGKGGYNCGYDNNIWNNSKTDTAVLYDRAGQVVDRRQE